MGKEGGRERERGRERGRERFLIKEKKTIAKSS